MDDAQPRTLYIGNLHSSVAEELLLTLFSKFGTVQSCKIIRDPNNDPYAFIEFTDHSSACNALTAMNKRLILNKEIKVNWATSPGNQPKGDISSHYHIFVGDLSPEIETETLREAFAPFGEISNCRIVKDPQTMKSKGYAFVSFVKKAEAENAIQAMNGQWIGSRAIRTNWSTRKLPPSRDAGKGAGAVSQVSGNGLKNKPRSTIEDIYNQSSPTNTTVYCGGFQPNAISEELIHQHFQQFGQILDVRVFKDKGYAFIKFLAKESAALAIEKTHLVDVYGSHVKCFWGKENGGDQSAINTFPNASASMAAVVAAAGLQTNMLTPQQLAAATSTTMPGQILSQQMASSGQYPYAATAYQQMSFWYPQTNFAGYPTAQVQSPYMPQGYYPYTFATQQPGAMPAGYRMFQPNIAWGVPGAVMPSVASPTTSAHNATNGITPQMLYNAGLQQYPTQ